MTAAPKIDVRDLNSVRRAAKEFVRLDYAKTGHVKRAGGDVLIGDDWVSPDGLAETDLVDSRRKRGLINLNRSPLARKIITFNLIALIILVAGMLYLTPSQDNLAFQRASGLVSEAELIADVFEAQMPASVPVNLVTGDGIDVAATMDGLDLRGGIEVFLFDPSGNMVGSAKAQETELPAGLNRDANGTIITDFLNAIWDRLAALTSGGAAEMEPAQAADTAALLVARANAEGTVIDTGEDMLGGKVFAVATPVMHNGQAVGVLAVTSAAGEINALVRQERERVLQMFVVGILVSIGLSLVLASTIANPIADLAAAAELGRDKNARKMSPGRIRIPDLTARPDEIGRLSAALRGMVAALYERIEGNEQFAADVAHEIKNPLASLRSAVGTMRIAKREDQRERMLDVIEHDVRRLDRLVSDIANASRLDSELVKEAESPFDLLKMLTNLNEFLAKEAHGKGIDYIADLPAQPIIIHGLEGRLAQVFVNLITNAISFCEDGDAIRIWARKRENRVLVVVEDTGPGIPENALTKIFQRFYSERPAGQFGNNSGLGLAISKQIVEAHGGVIWAENIRPTEADATSDPLGARFVVGLPV
ncbi:MAG: sensor histidine kinase [Rhodobacterales bacterium]|nr:sensor histidine kinase [Rhodobacterales bacterium]